MKQKEFDVFRCFGQKGLPEQKNRKFCSPLLAYFSKILKQFFVQAPLYVHVQRSYQKSLYILHIVNTLV